VLVDIEIKSPRRDGPWTAEDLALSTVALLRELGLTRRVFVTSFNPYVLAAVRQAAPEIRRGWLFCREDDQLWWYQRRILRHLRLNRWVAPDLLAPEHALCDPDHTAWRRRQGYRMLTWTVDDPDHMRSLITQGVRAIISNHPDRVEAVAGQI
jgi:glycerophosphoryl diester phosphodiesterase